MRKRLGLCAALFSLAISVAATAVPIDMTHFDVTLPTVITSGVLDPTDTAMTHEDFVPAAPYEMVIETIDKVPLDTPLVAEFSNSTVNPATISNIAVKLNINFERTSYQI